LADLTVQLALNLCREGILSQRRARLARGANIAQPIRIDRGMKTRPGSGGGAFSLFGPTAWVNGCGLTRLSGFPKALARL